MGEEQLIPKLRFNGFDEDYNYYKLEQLVDKISSGKTNIKKSQDENGKYPIFGSRNIIGYSNSFDYDGDFLLVARVGANAGTLYKVNGKCGVSDNTLMIVPSDLINKDYIYYYLKQYNLNRLIFGSGQPLITGKQLKRIDIHLPTLKEQNKIANFISKIDVKIDLLEKKYESHLNFKKYLMQQIFAQKLRFNFDEEWKNVKLEELTEKISSGKSNLKKSTDGDEKYPIYGSRGIIGYSNSYDYDDTFLLIARVGANAGSLFKISGKCGITDNTLVLKTNDLINDDYLFYYLKNYNLNRLVFGSGQPLITGKQLKNIKINLPNINEQNKISKMFIEVDNNINLLNNSIKLVLNFKKGLLQQMFV